MRASTLLLVAAALLIGSGAPARADGIALPAVDTFTLDNALQAQVARHATVPLMAIEVWIAAGAVDDPADAAGLAALTAESLRKGAGDLDAAAFAAALDFLGARFSTSVDAERTRIRLELLSRDLDTGLDLLADAILRPRFDEDEVLRLRDQMAERVISDKENPRNVLAAYHRGHLFAGHPYGRPVDGTETSLPGIDVDAVRAFHRARYTARRSAITVVGDVDVESVRAAIASRFGAMPAGETGPAVVSPPPVAGAPSVLLVDKSDTPQTWFRIGVPGPSWQDLDDQAATEIVRTVFGGRFTSWLNTALRIEAGLTYGASCLQWRGRAGGSTSISSFTATATTREALDLALAQLDRLHEEGLSQADLESARAYLRGQLPYDYETAADLAARLAELQFYDVDPDHVLRLFERLDAVTLADCRAAVDRWFARDDLQITAIGVAAEVREVLGVHGPVTEITVSDPGFAPPDPASGSR